MQEQLCPKCNQNNPAGELFCIHCREPLRQLLPRGAQLQGGRYEIQRVLGCGGFGTVYLATDAQKGTKVAIKENRWRGHNELFKEEATVLQGLDHPNLPKVYEVFEEDGRVYVVMEYIEGVNLKEHVSKKGALKAGEMLRIFKGVFDAVKYLHSRNPKVIHRDIKPANVIIQTGTRAYLVDFGIAKVIDPTKPGKSTTTSKHAVSPPFSPFEQYMRGGTDERSDVYALAATVYYSLTGVEPPDAIERAQMEDRGENSLPALENIELPDAAKEALKQAMEISKEKRCESAEKLWKMLLKAWNILPEAVEVKCLKTLEGHGASVESVTFSPDGNLLALGSRDGTLKLWDVERGECLKTLGHGSSVRFVTFSPDGNLLASVGEGGTIKLWDVKSGECLKTLEGHGASVRSVTFSPNGNLLALGSRDGTIKLWDVERGECLKTLEGHGGSVWSVTFSPDGNLLASGSWDGTIKLWDVERGECLKTLEGHGSSVESVTFSPDGNLLASGSEDRTIKLWDISLLCLLCGK